MTKSALSRDFRAALDALERPEGSAKLPEALAEVKVHILPALERNYEARGLPDRQVIRSLVGEAERGKSDNPAWLAIFGEYAKPMQSQLSGFFNAARDPVGYHANKTADRDALATLDAQLATAGSPTDPDGKNVILEKRMAVIERARVKIMAELCEVVTDWIMATFESAAQRRKAEKVAAKETKRARIAAEGAALFAQLEKWAQGCRSLDAGSYDDRRCAELLAAGRALLCSLQPART